MRSVVFALFSYFVCVFCVTAESMVSGTIFRVSYEPTGVFVSLMSNGSKVTSDQQACSLDDVFFLPTDTPNYSLLSATLYSYYLNAQPVDIKIDTCRYGAAKIISVASVMELRS